MRSCPKSNKTISNNNLLLGLPITSLVKHTVYTSSCTYSTLEITNLFSVCVCVQLVKDKTVIFDVVQSARFCRGGQVDELSKSLVLWLTPSNNSSWSGRSAWFLFIHQEPGAEQRLPFLFFDCLGLRIIAVKTEEADSGPLLFRVAHRWFHLSTTTDGIWVRFVL